MPSEVKELAESLEGKNLIPVQIKPSFDFDLKANSFQDQLRNPKIEEWFKKAVSETREYGAIRVECKCRGATHELNYPEEFHHKDNDCKCLGLCTLRCRIINGKDKMGRPLLGKLHRDPIWAAENAFVTGGTTQGIVASIAAISRLRVKPNLNKEYMATAIMRFCTSVGVVRWRRFTADRIEECKARGSHSAGFSTFKRQRIELEDEIIDFCWTASQDEARLPSIAAFKALVNRIRDNIEKEKKDYDPKWFPIMMAKMAIKAEIKGPDADRMKTRMFFIMSLLWCMIDSILYGDVFKKSYQKNGVKIGHKWREGGAEYMAREFHARDPDFFFVEADAEKLDTSLMASILILVFMMIPIMQRDINVSEDKLMRAFVMFSASNIAVTLVKWIGEQARWVLGVMFSGLFGTSWGDSAAMSLLLDCFEMFVHDRIEREEDITNVRQNPDAANWKKSEKPRGIYGDDLLLGFRRRFIKFITSDKNPTNKSYPDLLENYLNISAGIKLKRSDTHMYVDGTTPFFTELSEPIPGGTLRRIKKEGPKFLQRRFVVVEGMAFPWRESEDYFYRITRTTGQSLDLLIWIGRWKGLQLDTCGTNSFIFKLIQRMIDMAMDHLKTITGKSTEELYEMLDSFMTTRANAEQYGTFEHNVIQRFKKMGFDANYIGLELNQKNVRRLFAWNESHQRTLAKAYDGVYYNENSVKISGTLLSERSLFDPGEW